MGGPVADPHGDGGGRRGPGRRSGRGRRGGVHRPSGPGVARGRGRRGGDAVGVLRRGVPGVRGAAGGARRAGAGEQRAGGQPFRGPDRWSRARGCAGVPAVGAGGGGVRGGVLRGVVPVGARDPWRRVRPAACSGRVGRVVAGAGRVAVRGGGRNAARGVCRLGGVPVRVLGGDDRVPAVPAAGSVAVRRGRRSGAGARSSPRPSWGGPIPGAGPVGAERAVPRAPEGVHSR